MFKQDHYLEDHYLDKANLQQDYSQVDHHCLIIQMLILQNQDLHYLVLITQHQSQMRVMVVKMMVKIILNYRIR